MSQSGLPHDVVGYPCSDGQPMGESDIHRACMMYVTYALKRHYVERRESALASPPTPEGPQSRKSLR